MVPKLTSKSAAADFLILDSNAKNNTAEQHLNISAHLSDIRVREIVSADSVELPAEVDAQHGFQTAFSPLRKFHWLHSSLAT